MRLTENIQGAALLARAGHDNDAMTAVAELLATAARRKDWGAEIRLEFVERDEALATLRQHPEWDTMLADPSRYLSRR